jgi:hypothetical protein
MLVPYPSEPGLFAGTVMPLATLPASANDTEKGGRGGEHGYLCLFSYIEGSVAVIQATCLLNTLHEPDPSIPNHPVKEGTIYPLGL